jgi:CubicO group peptidase (beta-lactamase class C family)
MAIDDAVDQAIAKGDLPGAVVLVLHADKVVYRKAFGQRAKRPEPTLMSEDTIFDLASLTKPIFSALAIMLLEQDGKLNVDDPIGKHLPAFARRKETETITIAQLLTHTSGFPANNAVNEYQGGKDKAWEKVFAVLPEAAPGSRFKYSSFGYILLGKIVEKVSGSSLEEFGAKRIYGPLGMKDTTFHPSAEQKKRCAPTEEREGRWMIGEVHDPRAYALGGEAGHAGLFSTVDDLAIFARMMLNDGKHAGMSFLRPETLKLMTAPRKVMDEKGPGLRTYGWDMDTTYSSNRGNVFTKGVSYGHTGFTGTSIWIDPGSKSAVILLANRVHPDGKGNVVRLRGQVATIAGRAFLGN